MTAQKEGVVYTPENLANYVAKTAIEKFILQNINKRFSSEISDINEIIEINNKKTITMKGFHELLKSRNNREQLEYIFEILNSIKILDPAIGSGRFIIAALNYLEGYFFELKRLGIINWSNYKIREHIISNNLFGVDIEKIAIELTKKRLLSTLEDLLINTKSNIILPNIDSHFRIGNAVVGYLRKSEVKSPICEDLNSCFYEEIKSVFEIHKDLRKIELTEKQRKKMIYNLKPFHWFHEFPEIMENGGFDIIIGNPPYISNKQLSSLEKAIYQSRFKTLKGLMNIFVIFIERSIDLCNSSSILSYIIHKNFIRSNNYDLLRRYLLEHTTIKEIVDLGAKAFHSVTAETIIIVLVPRTPPKDHKILVKTNFFNHNNHIVNDFSLKEIIQKTYLSFENYNFNLNFQYEELEIINYIKDTKDCNLNKYFEAKTCIATGNDEKFLADHEIDNSYKKTLKGKNIGRYYIDFDGLYVLYDIKTLHRARDEAIFQKSEKLVMQTISSNLNVAYDNRNYYPLSTCIAIIPKNDRNNNFSIKYLLLLMNSKLLNFYYDFVFNLGAHLTTEISVQNINRLPLKSLQNYNLFNTLADMMNQLNEKEAMRDNNKFYIDFLEKLMDIIIFEIFFFDKFQLDGLNIELINQVSQIVIGRELNSIANIQRCIKDIKNDEDIRKEIGKIINHPWIKIIEEYFKK